MSFQSKVKASFRASKRELVDTRKVLADSILSLNNEFAKLLARMTYLERRIEELTGEPVKPMHKSKSKVKVV